MRLPVKQLSQVFTLAALFGCNKPPTTIPVGSEVQVEDKRAEVPKFERVYTSKLDNRAVLKVEVKTYWKGYRSGTGELTQPDGRWVTFDPDKIADKILDPLLVPMVQREVDTILAMDKAFIAGKPGEFIDEDGVRWKRQ